VRKIRQFAVVVDRRRRIDDAVRADPAAVPTTELAITALPAPIRASAATTAEGWTAVT
jgi:hypothetical protein